MKQVFLPDAPSPAPDAGQATESTQFCNKVHPIFEGADRNKNLHIGNKK